jgi:hypothetical protein
VIKQVGERAHAEDVDVVKYALLDSLMQCDFIGATQRNVACHKLAHVESL